MSLLTPSCDGVPVPRWPSLVMAPGYTRQGETHNPGLGGVIWGARSGVFPWGPEVEGANPSLGTNTVQLLQI